MGDCEGSCDHGRSESRLAYRLEQRLVPADDDAVVARISSGRKRGCARPRGGEQRSAACACSLEEPPPRDPFRHLLLRPYPTFALLITTARPRCRAHRYRRYLPASLGAGRDGSSTDAVAERSSLYDIRTSLTL